MYGTQHGDGLISVYLFSIVAKAAAALSLKLVLIACIKWSQNHEYPQSPAGILSIYPPLLYAGTRSHSPSFPFSTSPFNFCHISVVGVGVLHIFWLIGQSAS